MRKKRPSALRKLLRIHRYLDVQRAVRDLAAFRHLEQAVIELNNIAELKKVFQWSLDPILYDPVIYEFGHVEDVNERRIRDAESLGTAVRNLQPRVCIDVGTAAGHSAALIAVNAPQARVITINAPPEEIRAGNAGELTTLALEREQIGAYYRERGLTNIEQLFVNTAEWQPGVASIDFAFVDGCHDTDFVLNDTRKILSRMKSGAVIAWHDFNPQLVRRHNWIRSVCLAIDQLLEAGDLRGYVFHVRDSWTGIYRVS
jgi:predicted O-methyltransferase YrrM